MDSFNNSDQKMYFLNNFLGVCHKICDLVLYVPVNNFSVMSRGSSCVEPVARINVSCCRTQHSDGGEA